MEQQPCAPRVTLEHVVQRGHPLAGVAPVESSAGVEPGDLDPVRLVHRAGAAANLAQRAIVVNHGDTVPRELQVELEAVAPLGQRCVSAEPVRPITPELKQLVDTGYRQSHTFRSIVDGLVGSFVIVHLVPAASLPSDFAGGLQFVTTANGYRYLRIFVRTDLDPAVLIAVLGHELQHAFEIGQAPHVVDLATLRDFYRLTGIEACLDSPRSND